MSEPLSNKDGDVEIRVKPTAADYRAAAQDN